MSQRAELENQIAVMRAHLAELTGSAEERARAVETLAGRIAATRELLDVWYPVGSEKLPWVAADPPE
jgi:hypothetical protein